MPYTILADLTLILHLLFILFVLLGALLVLKWKQLVWIHIPCVIWGVLLEINHWICPLTYLENYFRKLAGNTNYSGGFIEHYLTPVIYPPGLTPGIQILLAVAVILVNLVIYSLVVRTWLQSCS